MINANSAAHHSTFGERLSQVFSLQSVTDRQQQVEKVAQCLGVRGKTAEKYLQATTFPDFLNRRALLFYKLAEELGVSAEWLYDGRGYSPEAMQVAKNMESMTEWEKNKFLRFAIRLLNHDPKARRLGDMFHSGRISRQQFLAAM